MNTKHQLGVEAARSGQRRDERMSAEWLAGFDAENDISAGEMVFRGADERRAVVAWLREQVETAEREVGRGWVEFVGDTLDEAADAIERGEHMEGAK